MKHIDIILNEEDLELLRRGGSIEKEQPGVRVYVAASSEAQRRRISAGEAYLNRFERARAREPKGVCGWPPSIIQ